MPELSILVPAVGCQRRIDDTLISVLENRSSDCEVLVVCGPDYEDPYALGDEVRFIRATQNGSWAFLANQGLAQLDGRFAHLILPGVLACGGWSEPALNLLHKADDQTLAVAPLIERDDASGIAIHGLASTLGGFPRSCHGCDVVTPALPTAFFPALRGGFYRTEGLRELGGWHEQVHPGLADFELALRAAARGFRYQPCTVSRMIETQIDACILGGRNSFQYARDLERIRRHYSQSAWVRIPALLGDSCVALTRLDLLRALGHWAGMMGGALDPPTRICSGGRTKSRAA